MREFNNTLIQGPPIIRIDEANIPYVLCTSDLHLNHKNILYYTRRLDIPGIKDVVTMEDLFIKNINDAISTVDQSKRNKVMVINCGDFIFASGQNSYEHYLNFRNKLIPCKWYNVSGNHDNNNLYRTVKFISNDSGFEELKIQNQSIVQPAWYWSSMYIMEIYRGAQVICVLTISHYPQDDFLGCVNIHGHLHTYEDLTYFKGSDKDWAIKLREDGHHQDVGVDRFYGKPVWLSDILEGKLDVNIANVPQLKSMKWQYKINFR